MAKRKIDQKELNLDDKSFWSKAILAPLEKFKKAHPENGDLAFLEMIIKNRQFLNIRDFNITIDGIRLRVSPSDTAELAQAKLAEFFETLEEQNNLETENIYTSEDRNFWRLLIIPTISKLSEYYGNDPGFRFLSLLVEKRLLTQSSKERGLNITVGNVSLSTAPGDTKKVVQKKLEEFLESLANPSSFREIYKESTELGDDLVGRLKKNWGVDQKVLAKEVKSVEKEGERYTKADKLFWNQVVLPNLAEMENTYPDNPEVKKLVKAIHDRKFLKSGTWTLSANGINLQVNAKDSQDEKQEKLGNFLVSWQEKTYTRNEQNFWRMTVIPALQDLARVYTDNAQMKVLVMTIQNRQFLRQRNLYLVVAGVSLNITPENTKKQALNKLKKFLDELQEKSKVGITQKQVEERLKRLQASFNEEKAAQVEMKKTVGSSKFRNSNNGEGGHQGGGEAGPKSGGGESGAGINRGGGESGARINRVAGGESGAGINRGGGEGGSRITYHTGGGESRSSGYRSSGE